MPGLTQIFNIAVDPALIPDEDLAPLMEALSDLEPVLEAWGQEMQQAQRENFATAGGLFGGWADLAASTEWEKHRKDYPPQPLVRTGRLQDAIGQTVLLTPNSVTTGIDLADVPYAAYHQEGTARMPARVLVAVTEDEIDAMLDTLRQYIADATGGSLAGVTITVGEA